MIQALYDNCDLPLPLFEQATVSGDLSVLIRDGLEHTEDDLRDAWLKINDEYLQLIGDATSAGYSTDLTQHAVINGRMTLVQALCEIAACYPVDGILKHLREIYPDLAFPSDDAEQLQSDFDMVGLKLERDSIDAEQLTKKLEEEAGKETDSVDRPKQETFDRIKLAINRKEKVAYDFTKLTTRQYAILVESLKNQKVTQTTE